MRIVGTFSDSSRRPLGQAVGVGATEYEAVTAVLESAKWFADQNRLSGLREHIRAALRVAPPGALEADFEEGNFAVRIYW